MGAIANIAKIINGWKFSKEYTGNEFLQYIVFSLREERRPDGYNTRKRPKWNVDKLNIEILVLVIE